jgi:ribosome maturation factor RimP
MSGLLPTFLFSEPLCYDLKEKVRQLAEPVVAAEGMELIHVECLKMQSRWIIRLFLDKEIAVLRLMIVLRSAINSEISLI